MTPFSLDGLLAAMRPGEGVGPAPAEAARAAAALGPAFALAVTYQAANAELWASFLRRLSDLVPGAEGAARMGSGSDALNPRTGAERARDEAAAAFFGSAETARRVAEQAARVSGVGLSVVEAVMPALARRAAQALPEAPAAPPEPPSLDPAALSQAGFDAGRTNLEAMRAILGAFLPPPPS